MRFVSLILLLLICGCGRKVKQHTPLEIVEEPYFHAAVFDGEKQPAKKLQDDVCALLSERPHWKQALSDVKKRWHIDPWQILAFLHQESRFNPTAMSKSRAYGYPQAKDATWDWYKTKRLRSDASRERFDDSVDFIGWYAHQNQARNGVALHDVRRQYLAYHEGLGGFERQTYLSKPWLMIISEKVVDRAAFYQTQILNCL